jgi:hypothetical protein
MLALCAVVAGAVALPAGATDRTVFYAVPEQQECVDYSIRVIAVATRPLPGATGLVEVDGTEPFHPCPFFDHDPVNGPSGWDPAWSQQGWGFELIFAGGGQSTKVAAVGRYDDGALAPGDRSRNFIDLGSCEVHLTTDPSYGLVYQPAVIGPPVGNDCDGATDSSCYRLCVVKLLDIE